MRAIQAAFLCKHTYILTADTLPMDCHFDRSEWVGTTRFTLLTQIWKRSHILQEQVSIALNVTTRRLL
jgi:hypothetical protein